MQSKGQNTVTQNTAPPAQVLQQYQNVQNAANSASSNPYYWYPGQLVAGMSPEQTSAIGATTNTATALENPANSYGIAQPYLNESGQLTLSGSQPITASQINSYMNPFLNQVGQTTLAEIGQNNAIQQNQLTGNAAASGALGGNRVGLARAALANQQDLATNATLANINAQGFNTALGAAQTTAGQQLQGGFLMGQTGQLAENAALSGLNAGLTGEQAQFGMGTAEQQQQQNELNAQYGQWLGQVQYPFQETNFLAGVQSGIGSLSGGTGATTYPSPSALSQVAGLGLAGAGIYNMLGLGATTAATGGVGDLLGMATIGGLKRGGRLHRDLGGAIYHATMGPDGTYAVVPQAEAAGDPGYIGPTIPITHGAGSPTAPSDPSLSPEATSQIAGFSSLPDVMKFVEGMKGKPKGQQEAVSGANVTKTGGRAARAAGGISVGQVPTPLSEQILDYQEMGQLYPGGQVQHIQYQAPQGVYSLGGQVTEDENWDGPHGFAAGGNAGMKGVNSMPLVGAQANLSAPGAGTLGGTNSPGTWGTMTIPTSAPLVHDLAIGNVNPGAHFASVTSPGGSESGTLGGSTGMPAAYQAAVQAAAPHPGWTAVSPPAASTAPSSSSPTPENQILAAPGYQAGGIFMPGYGFVPPGPIFGKRGGRFARGGYALGGEPVDVTPLPDLENEPQAVSLGDGPPSPNAFPVETAGDRLRAAQRSNDILSKEAAKGPPSARAADERNIARNEALIASGAKGWPSGTLTLADAGTPTVNQTGSADTRAPQTLGSGLTPTPPLGAYPEIEQAARAAAQPVDKVHVPETTKLERMAESPWAALTDAGFAMMAGTSPFAGVNIGRGMMSGVDYAKSMLQQQRARQELQSRYGQKNVENVLTQRGQQIQGAEPLVQTQEQGLTGLQVLPQVMTPNGPVVLKPRVGTMPPQPGATDPGTGQPLLPPVLGLPAQTFSQRYSSLTSLTASKSPIAAAAQAELSRMTGYLGQGVEPTGNGAATMPTVGPGTSGPAPATAPTFDPSASVGIPPVARVPAQSVSGPNGEQVTYADALNEARRAAASPWAYLRNAGQTWLAQYGPQVSQPQINDLTESANQLANQKEQLDTLLSAAEQFPVGTGAHQTAQLYKAMATVAQAIGVDAPQLQDKATSAQIIPKVATFIQSVNSRMASQRGGAQIMQMVEQATPGLTNTRQGVEKLVGLYKTLANRAQAMSKFVTDAVQSGQMTYNYAVNAFNAEYPPDMWASRVDPLPLPVAGGKVDVGSLKPGYGYTSPKGASAVWNGEAFVSGE